jgi:hypothetical protein
MIVGDRKRSPTIMFDAKQRTGVPYDMTTLDRGTP